MSAAQTDARGGLIGAARTMLVDAVDEARGISMQAEEAGEALAEGELLQALGILADYDDRAKALQAAVDAASTLIMRARVKRDADAN